MMQNALVARDSGTGTQFDIKVRFYNYPVSAVIGGMTSHYPKKSCGRLYDELSKKAV